MRSWLTIPFLIALAACGAAPDRRPVHVDVIGTAREITDPLAHASADAAAVTLAATRQGLVALDARGDIIDGLAERWIVQDGGRIFIFRLKRTRWTDGTPVKAEEVARLLRARLARSGRLLAGIQPEVKAMTEEVLEVDLNAPMPLFLQLLAQPSIAIARPAGGTGPLTLRAGDGGYILRAPKVVGTADQEVPSDIVATPDIHVRAHRAALAFARFKAGESDLVLGGRFQHLPLISAAAPPDGTVRADPASGLFGLLVEGKSDFLATPHVREAINMAIDRDRIATLLNLAGWQTRTTLLPSPVDLGRAPSPASWTVQALDLRQSYARSVVANWTLTRGEPPPRLRIALPSGAGADILYGALARNLARIGLRAERVGATAPADLRLIDEVAPWDSALWYLARIGCEESPHCSINADARLKFARQAESDADRVTALGEAETQAVADNVFIPIGEPIRFSLVRARLTGYALSPRGHHPLTQLFRAAP